jgi:UDP-galactopyranose mutase
MMERLNYLVVGARFAGAALADRIATQVGKTSLIVECRNYIGGNAYDYYDKARMALSEFDRLQANS